MSTHIATQQTFHPSFVGADKPVESTASPRLRLIAAERTEHSPKAIWLPSENLATTSRIGKGGAFVLALFAHVAAFALLANLRSQPNEAPPQPAKVVIIAEEQSAIDVPKPPQPKMEMPQFEVPIVPIVIDAFDSNSSEITVAQRPVEQPSTAVANAGTPKEVSNVEYLREPAAKRPPAARALKQRGTVLLRALVDVEGRVREVQVYRSSGFKLLDDAARNALLNALFKPYTENGRSLPVYVRVPIEFGANG